MSASVVPTAADRAAIFDAFASLPVQGRVLVMVPDGTRTFPHPTVLNAVASTIAPRVATVDVMIALGTHQELSRADIDRLFDRSKRSRGVGESVRILNHRWWEPNELADFGSIPATEVAELSEGRLSLDVTVRLNRRLLDYDHLVVCGPVFPHEVAGFSGGNKYFVPGVAAQEVIDVTHWLGALITSSAVIGKADTPVRRLINRAACMIPRPRHAVSLVIDAESRIQVFSGDIEASFDQAAKASRVAHVRRLTDPVDRVLAILPAMYDELWVGAKGMYKLDPVVADGGELVIVAPHLHQVSATHGELISRIGYHVRDYFTAQWDRFQHIAWGVLAHSTHLRGTGTFIDGVERPRINVTLATGIPEATCRALALGYRDPDSIDVEKWRREGALIVDRAGETLYLIDKSGSSARPA